MKKIFVLITVFSFVYAFWGVNKHNRFQTDAVDLGIFDQPLWHYSRLESPKSTVKYNQFPGEHILGDHFHPVLIALAPLYWIWDDVRIIIIAQAILAVLSVWPIYKISMMKLGSEFFSLALSFSYLTFIGLQTALDYDFHETAVSILPFSFALYFLIKENYLLYGLSAFIATFTKEDMPLFVLMMGIFTILKLRKVKVGGASILFGVASYLLITQVFIPFFKHDKFAYEELDPRLGKTTFDLVKMVFYNPLAVLETLFTPDLKTKTMLNLVGSFGFLPLLSPLTLILTVPNLVSRFLTKLSQRWLIRYQYSINLVPALALASIFGVENLKMIPILRKHYSLVLFVCSAMLVVSPIIQTIRTNSPLTRVLNLQSYKYEARFKINYELLARIPKDVNVSVMAQSSFVPHLSHRHRIFRYEDGLIDKAKPDYVVMSADEASDPPYVRKDLETKIQILKNNLNYEAVYWDGIRLLLKRV